MTKIGTLYPVGNDCFTTIHPAVLKSFVLLRWLKTVEKDNTFLESFLCSFHILNYTHPFSLQYNISVLSDVNLERTSCLV